MYSNAAKEIFIYRKRKCFEAGRIRGHISQKQEMCRENIFKALSRDKNLDTIFHPRNKDNPCRGR